MPNDPKPSTVLDSFDPYKGTYSTPDDGKWHLICFLSFGDTTVKIYKKVLQEPPDA